MKTQFLQIKNVIAAAIMLSAGSLSAQQWNITGNSSISNSNYVGTIDEEALFLRVNGKSLNPGQALLNTTGSFLVESVNNSNDVKTKGSVVVGANNTLGLEANSSMVNGWENDLSEAGGANIVAGQGNVLINNATKSVALGWVNRIRDANQFAIGVGVDLKSPYSGGFGVDLIATGNRSFVFGSGTGWGSKLTNDIPYSIMFGVTSTPTMLIKDQMIGVRTIDPTANFHTVGTVRLQGLPDGDGRALVVDDNGNVMVAKSHIHKAGNNDNETNLQTQIDNLKKEMEELKNLLKQNKMNVDLTSESNIAKLYQNAPNPSKGETIIKYYLPNDAKEASITIYNISGQLIKTIALKEKGNGNVNITGLQGGSYLYQMKVNGKNIDSKKMTLKD